MLRSTFTQELPRQSLRKNSFDKLNGDDLLVTSIERFGDDKIAIDNENSILVSDNDDVKREVITVEDKKEMDSIMTSELIYGVTGSFLTDVSFDFYKKKKRACKGRYRCKIFQF